MTYPWLSNVERKDKDDENSGELEEKVKTVAKNELREEKSIRESSLEQFKEWIKQNHDLEDCRMDDNFLLRFLRVKKYSIPMAEQTLLKYLNLRKTFWQMSENLDCLNPRMNELITNGYLFASPVRDVHGRRVLIYLIKNFDPFKFNCVDMARIHMITYETLLDDDYTQVMGFTHIGDVAHSTAAHVTLWSPSEFATLCKWGEQSFPIRHKEVHILNLPSAVRYVFDFAMGRFSQKIKNRVKLYSSISDLHKSVDPNVLPKEYGGTIPMTDMIEMWKKELREKRDKLLQLDRMKLLSDRGIICRRNNCNNGSSYKEQSDIGSLPGSFRRLEVD